LIEQEMADCHVTPWVWAEHTRTATTLPGP